MMEMILSIEFLPLILLGIVTILVCYHLLKKREVISNFHFRTLEDRLIDNYDKSLNAGRMVLVTVATVLLKGCHVADTPKFLAMSNGVKKKTFNQDQLRHVVAKTTLAELDTSLLHIIIKEFGGLASTIHLLVLIKSFKDRRNQFAHERQTLSLTKIQLELRVDDLKTLYSDIFKDLENHCDAKEKPLLHKNKTDMDAYMDNLKKLIDDDLEEISAKLYQESTKLEMETVQAKDEMKKMNKEMKSITTKTVQAAEEETKKIKIEADKMNQEMKTIKTETVQAAKEETNKFKIEAVKTNQEMKTTKTEIVQATEEGAKVTEELKLETVKASETIDKLTEANTSWKDKINEVMESLNSELITYILCICKLQLVEGFEGFYNASPVEIMTDFIMLKVGQANGWDTEQIPYKSVLLGSKENEVIILKGNSGFGKTTFNKFIGLVFGSDKKDNIDNLSSFKLLLYMECRNRAIACFDDLLNNIFPDTPDKFKIPHADFRKLILKQKLLFIIDGYDEVNPSTSEAVTEILQLRSENVKIMISTRPVSLSEVKYLVPDFKEHVVMEMLGIQKSQYKDFVMRILHKIKKIESGQERENICEELVSQLERLENTMGNFLNSPMILTNLTILQVENPDGIKAFTITSEVHQALQDMRINKMLKRMKLKIHLLGDFMSTFFKVAAETFINSQYDVVPVEKVAELESKLDNSRLPKEQVMSSMFVSYEYHVGKLCLIGYKYTHRSQQEFLCAKYIGMVITEDIKDDQVLKDNLIWKFVYGKMSKAELEQGQKHLSKFKNVLFFLIGVLASQPQSKEIFKLFSEKLIHIGWYLNENTELLNLGYKKDDKIGTRVENTDIGEMIVQNREDNMERRVNTLNKSTDPEVVAPEVINESLDSNKGSGTGIKSNIVQIEEEEITNFGKEDNLLRCVLESKRDDNMKKSAISKLSTISCWKFTRSECLIILNEILVTKSPNKIVIALEYDPPTLSAFHDTISLLNKTRIPFELYLTNNFRSEKESISNAWLDANLNLLKFLGAINEDEAHQLPNTLEALHIRVDDSMLATLNKRLTSLTRLDVLGIRIILNKNTEWNSLPKLEFRGAELCIILVCELEDDDASCIADMARNLCPDQRNGKLTGLWLQQTKITELGIVAVLSALQNLGIEVTGWVKIWTTKKSSYSQSQLDELANRYGHSGLQVFNTMSLDEMIPKKMMNTGDVSSNTTNTMSLDEMIPKKMMNTGDVSSNTTPTLSIFRSHPSFAVHIQEGIKRYGEIVIENNLVLLRSFKIEVPPTGTFIFNLSDVRALATKPVSVYLEISKQPIGGPVGAPLGRVIMELNEGGAPRRALQLETLCSGQTGAGFTGATEMAAAFKGRSDELFCVTSYLSAPSAGSSPGEPRPLSSAAILPGLEPPQRGSVPHASGLVLPGGDDHAGLAISTQSGSTRTRTGPLIGRVTAGLHLLGQLIQQGDVTRDEYKSKIIISDSGIIIKES